jgi:hypothetical protein
MTYSTPCPFESVARTWKEQVDCDLEGQMTEGASSLSSRRHTIMRGVSLT